MKFTERGKIEISVNYDDVNEILRVAVSDTGAGMTEKE